jgi:trk system potassium uptake protein TrkH
LFTFGAETIGTILIYEGLQETMPQVGDRLFCALFHAVSAFCNAGFSTLSDSLMGVADNSLVVGTVAGLLIIGGLGFSVAANLLAYWQGRLRGRRKTPHRRLTLQTRVVLLLTVVLLLAGTVLLAAIEWNGALAGQPLRHKLSLAFFQSATARTAGFNTLDIAALSQPALFLLIVLMFIGAAPGSTAGGVKLTTLAVMWANLLAIGRGMAQTRLWDREVSLEAVRRAMVVLSGGVIFGTLGIFLLLLTERQDLMATIFEVVSAQGTVGLSTGLTGELTQLGRVIIIVMMYAGRLGPLTFAYSLVPHARDRDVRLPQTKIMVG